jgi:hypothetical protein
MRESVGRGLDLGGVVPPGVFVDVALVGAALPVDELPDDVRMARVLRCFRDHPDEQDTQGGVTSASRPVRHRPRCVQVECGDDAVGVGTGAAVKPGDVLA